MAFVYRGSLGTNSPRMLEKNFIIANSVTVAVGDFVGFTTGYVQRVGANAAILGLCIGFRTANGNTLERAESGTGYDGTFTASTQTYIATSDNQTDKKVVAVVIVDPLGIYSGPADAAIGKLLPQLSYA